MTRHPQGCQWSLHRFAVHQEGRCCRLWQDELATYVVISQSANDYIISNSNYTLSLFLFCHILRLRHFLPNLHAFALQRYSSPANLRVYLCVFGACRVQDSPAKLRCQTASTFLPQRKVRRTALCCLAITYMQLKSQSLIRRDT